MEPVIDVCILYDLACANCGQCDNINIHADLGVTLCDSECLQAYLNAPSLRKEPILTDVEQHFWSDEEQGYIIAASLSSIKRKTKSKAKKAKTKAEEVKRKVKKGGSKAKSKAKEGASKAKGALEDAGEGAAGGGGFAPATVPEDLLTEADFDSSSDYEEYLQSRGLAKEAFSLRYLLAKHEFVDHHLDAEQLMELRPFVVANNFGTFMLDYAISTLAEEQGKPAIAARISNEMAESEARLIVST